MLKWIPGALIAAAFAASALIQSQFPSPVAVEFHRLLPAGLASGTDSIPRTFALFGLPAVALLIWALLFEAPVSRLGLAAARLLFKAGPPRYDLFAPTYRLIVLWVVSLVLSLHLAVLADALRWSLEPGLIVGIVLGAGMVLVGNSMPRLRQNAVAGIRTARTMSDPVAWARVHRTAGAIWFAAGLLTVAVSIVAPSYALMTGLGLFVLSSIAGLISMRTDLMEVSRP